MITDLFLSVLEVSITTSLVSFLLIMCSPVINRRYGAKWKCWIWLFQALRLLIPVGVEDIRSAADILARTIVGGAQIESLQSDLSDGENITPRQVMIELPAQIRRPVGAQPERDSEDRITWLELAAFVWLAGCVGFVVFHLLIYLHYRRQIEREGENVRDDTVLQQLSLLFVELHIKGRIPVKEYAGAGSPMIAGFWKPVLVLPVEEYGEEELYFILKHELTHLKRRDVWFKLLLMLTNGVHWFNPLVWMMHREAVVDMELACDEQVVLGKGYRIRKAYTETLLSSLHKKAPKGQRYPHSFMVGSRS